jgi:hypothetical protein
LITSSPRHPHELGPVAATLFPPPDDKGGRERIDKIDNKEKSNKEVNGKYKKGVGEVTGHRRAFAHASMHFHLPLRKQLFC